MAFPHDLDPSARTPLDRLSLAFAVAVARSIADADGVYDADEIRILGRFFPDSLMREFSFVDERGELTESFVVAREQALLVLPDRLDESRKLEILHLLHHMAIADGELHEAEFRLLQQAADHLQFPLERLTAHIAQQPNSGSAPPPVRPTSWDEPKR
ncbi:MAG: putative tellurite resistance protein B-like protein [Myxococcota bacterium]|jgi:uncharacterized tellurite resistance protein B-like protein